MKGFGINFFLAMLLLSTAGAAGEPSTKQEGWKLLGSGLPGRPIGSSDVEKEAVINRAGAPHGETSLERTITAPEKEGAVGVILERRMKAWPVTKEWSVHFWLKLSKDPQPKAWSLVLFDQEGNRASLPLANRATDNQWHEFSLPLRVFETESGFDFGKLATWQLEAPFPKGTTVSLDHLYFYNPVTQESLLVVD